MGRATVGLLSSTMLYVAGFAGGNDGTLDIVDITTLTRTTANSIPINDGQQWKMAINNNKLYIGAKTCINTVTGCLSVVNLATGIPDPPFPPLGPVTGLLSVPKRNVMYVVPGRRPEYLRHHQRSTAEDAAVVPRRAVRRDPDRPVVGARDAPFSAASCEAIENSRLQLCGKFRVATLHPT